MYYIHRDRSYLLDRQDQLSGVGLAGGPDEVDHLVVGVAGNVAAVDQHDLVALVQLRVTPAEEREKIVT